METLRTKLSDRLQMVASFVNKGDVIADIGTDHAYLPAYLISNKICPKAIASDIGTGPLKNAEKIVFRANLHQHIKLMISDGLEKYSPDDADVFIFAGIGGTLIVKLLENIDWIKNNEKRFIFQPMSHSEDVISFLINNGFEIEEEKSCFDSGRCYVAFSARYTQTSKKYDECFPYIGLLPNNSDESSKHFISKQYNHLKKRADALNCANINLSEQKEIRKILSQIERYL